MAGKIYKMVNGVKEEVTTEEVEKIRAERAANEAETQATKYSRDRQFAYPAIQDQMDMLYHELETSGSLTTSGSWFKAITSVKDANPKPE
ncbi:MAG: hypothetical protein QF535_12115 [Anaerolineales bacterium]|nr:hypothetical protein [Anaerolineales bacterium]